MPSINKAILTLTRDDKNILLLTAHKAIESGLKNKTIICTDEKHHSAALQTQAASFVTLNIKQQLRGCIGTLQAHQSLLCDVSEHAYAAAFKDPRFAPLSDEEYTQVKIHISILTPAEPLHCQDEQALFDKIRADVDGVILKYKHHQATFLPSVWQQLPDKQEFIQHLKLKAGLNKDFWHKDILIETYQTFSITE